MRKIFCVTMPEWATADRLRKAWDVQSDLHDTHPCLRERIEALGLRYRLPDAFKSSAAEVLLGEHAAALVKEFDAAWWREEKGPWQEYHRRQMRIAELETQAPADLGAAELQELALLLLEYRSPSAAKPILEHLLRRPGERYAKALYLYGRVLLDEGDSRGLEQLEQAYRDAPPLREDCARAGYEWLAQSQGEAAAERWLERLPSAPAAPQAVPA